MVQIKENWTDLEGRSGDSPGISLASSGVDVRVNVKASTKLSDFL
jgi:hypothetical protein